jgi:zinc transport system substrate-binding protein
MRLRGCLVIALAVAVMLSACGGSGAGSRGDGDLEVLASFYPLEFVVARVGGEAVQLESLTPTGVEPHDLELSSSQVIELSEAELAVYVGQGFQPAVEDAVESLDDSRRLDVLDGRDLLEGSEADHGEEGDHGEQDEHAELGHSEADPHVWLDPSIMAAIANEVAARLAKLDPSNADLFESNAARLEDDLLALDESFAAGLSNCDSREFVTSHAAFGYLAARYDLEQVSVSGIDPEAEPSPQRLAEIARFVADHDVSVIFFEDLAPASLAETLARETGARTEVLSPLETAPDDGDFIDEMTRNLQRLRSALGCE